MRNQQHNIKNPKDEILTYLSANNLDGKLLRRRAVVYKESDKFYTESFKWVLYACIVEGIAPNRELMPKKTSREYSHAVLFEDWLTTDELLVFVEDLIKGQFRLGGLVVNATCNPRQWSKERLPLSNSYMSSAGYLWASRIQDDVFPSDGELLTPKQPYYPDLKEAIKDWLALPIFRTNYDARKGEVILLLPETRAYFADAIPNDDKIELKIAGEGVDNLALEVKGAWWDESGIHHFDARVSDGCAQLTIPNNANRLEYVLVGETNGEVYDYQQEEGNHHTGLGRKNKTEKERTLAHVVLAARQNGEDIRNEFKPFIFPESEKLSEVTRTVAAFSNAQGGRIFLGINDVGQLEGIDENLQKWAEAKPDESSCERYLGALKGKIRGGLLTDVDMQFHQVVVDEVRVVVIEVGEAKKKIVTTRKEEFVLYVRRGASNTKVNPKEWAAIGSTSKNGFLSFKV